MINKVQTFDSFLYNEFVFLPRYRALRHALYWIFHIVIWAAFWQYMGSSVSYWRILFNMSLWIPVFILFSYPLVYLAIPHLLIKGKVVQFALFVLAWAIAGLFINAGFRTYLYVPIQEILGLGNLPAKGQQPHSYLCMTTSAASPMVIRFFKLWTLRQREWMQAHQEKATAELQLLKSQVHPHFLFNTLNNIYSFSMEYSPKTPGLINKLSSLLNYMLYDCKSEKVSLAKEIEVLKNYIDLERERFGNRVEISWKQQGDVSDKRIAPLLMLPLLENAFKHGLSEQIGKPWLRVELCTTPDSLYCTISNSKNECPLPGKSGCGSGLGINNVRKRLALIYPGESDLSLRDGGDHYVAALEVKLSGYKHIQLPLSQEVGQLVPA